MTTRKNRMEKGESNVKGSYKINGKQVYTTADRAKAFKEAGVKVEVLKAPKE